jgi:hypothetical protein
MDWRLEINLIKASLGGSAKVLKSTGFHSKKYIDEVGYAVKYLPSPQGKCWVLRFPSAFP